MKRPLVLTILDGWGYSKERVGNAIFNASKPNLDTLEKNYPSLLLQASGLAVGMTWGEAGNSEVGHLTLGAGRSVSQYLTRINRDIETGYFFQNQELVKAVNNAKTRNSTIHIIGLLGSGSVHSYFNHILALLELLKRNVVTNYKLHLFTDGKDSSLKGSVPLLKKLDEYVPGSLSNLATIIGRDLAMDRNGQWELTQKTYDLLVNGKGTQTQDVFDAINDFYNQGFNDSNIPPTVVSQSQIKDNDSLIFFNFREDSMRQIIKSFIEPHFNFFPIQPLGDLFVASFTPYIESLDLHVAYPAPFIVNGLSEILSINGKNQFHIAETEKYAHVTYFFNCLKNKPFGGETDLIIKSGADHLVDPKMKAGEIISRVIEELDKNFYDFYVINIANADALAHLGNLESTTAAIEAVDQELGRLSQAVLNKDGILIITADHGNAERVIYKSSGNAETKHDQNPVPFYLIAREFQKSRTDEDIIRLRQDPVGILSDVAPTILELMRLPVPEEMTGDSLLKLI